MAAKRCLAIGLDGCTWRVFDPFIQQGLMPRIGELCDSGYRSVLNSTVPALTPVAWTTYATGMNPGKHGVFGFVSPQRSPGEYSHPLVRRSDVAVPTLWRRLSDLGLTCTVLCVPMSYPPEPINGSLVTGMFTPGVDSDCTHPSELKQELIDAGCMPRFELSVTSKQAHAGRKVERIQDAIAMTEEVGRTVAYLLKKPWDFFTVVFVTPDRIQHGFWPEIAAGASTDSDVDRALRHFYATVDRVVGEIMDQAGDETVTMLMSDHGFGPRPANFALGRWAVEAGFATLKGKSPLDSLRALAKKIGLGGSQAAKGAKAKLVSASMPYDWAQTRAYAMIGGWGLNVNLKGRQKFGSVEPGQEYESVRRELLESVARAEEPIHGGRVVEHAYLREELYHGDQLEWAPDVIVSPTEEAGYDFVVGDAADPRLALPSAENPGGHRPDGIFVAHGPGIRAFRDAPPADIADLAPTIMSVLGLDVPEKMDGKVIHQALQTS